MEYAAMSTHQPFRDEEDRPGLRFTPGLVATFERYWVEEAAATTEHQIPSLLTQAAARVLGVDGAGLCVQTSPDRRLPLGASDEASATAERLQFTVGEGPCFEALASRRPITFTAASMLQRWPVLAVLHQELTPFKAGLAIPLRAGQVCFGVLDLYLTQSRGLDGHDVIAAQLIAQSIADVLLETLPLNGDQDVARRSDSPVGWRDTPAVRRRRNVWVATGMANLLLGLRHDDALATLRAYALVREQSLDALAHDIVFGHIDLVELDA